MANSLIQITNQAGAVANRFGLAMVGWCIQLKSKEDGMRIRGDVFWSWADPTLHHRTHDETLDDGTFIDVQVRLSRTGNTQMFIVVYAPSGSALHEEAFESRPGESMTRALTWGVGRARRIAIEGAPTANRLAASK